MNPASASAQARLQVIHQHLSIQPCFHRHAIDNDKPTGPADLARERANASFKVEDMTEILFGGKENVVARSLAFQMIQRDPDLRMRQGHNYDMSRSEEREQTLRQVARLIQLRRMPGNNLLSRALTMAMSYYSEAFWMMFVHDVLFKQAFTYCATPEQQDKWMADIEDWRVMGCFAMTELGHSSNLPGLETTSTFDRSTDEFVIHSPTQTSTKWWIGMAGRTATHTVAMCRTLVDGKDYGPNWFYVPLRDRKTGHLLPGIVCGDVGQKASRQGLDTGYIQFTQVRIPRGNMLQRWASFTPQGVFKPSPNPVLAYSPLTTERFATLNSHKVTLAQSLTIAVRYGAVRRQGTRDEQIIDYQTHQANLMPGLAFIHLLSIVERDVCEKWDEVQEMAHTNVEQFLHELPDQHGIAASFKAALSWYVTEALESCRRSCGGHAYSAYNAFPGLIGDYNIVTIGGGDNVVLMQQSARYLISSLKKAMTGHQVHGSVDYMNAHMYFSSVTKTSFQDPRDLLNHEFFIDALTWACLKKATGLKKVLENAGTHFEEVWIENQTELIRLADINTWRYFLVVFHRVIEREKERKPEVYALFKRMGLLMGTFILKRYMDVFLEEGYFDGSHAKFIRELHLDQCKDLRKEAVALVDSWAIPDFALQAPIGKYDGDIYPAYFAAVNAAQQSFEPTDYWLKYAGPLLNAPRPTDKEPIAPHSHVDQPTSVTNRKKARVPMEKENDALWV
ncbi:acyl-CoA oxidase [Entomortierella parvispora]|uniref:Acyl-coenzyme A oxidase n=1 Tax=Entomortierella parvispora TaxID=205924 RepID=A0A9P3HG68_9FUNG|nr:acyl-CoA oxidase [Entomortierella parvispora]